VVLVVRVRPVRMVRLVRTVRPVRMVRTALMVELVVPAETVVTPALAEMEVEAATAEGPETAVKLWVVRYILAQIAVRQLNIVRYRIPQLVREWVHTEVMLVPEVTVAPVLLEVQPVAVETLTAQKVRPVRIVSAVQAAIQATAEMRALTVSGPGPEQYISGRTARSRCRILK
jgi:hypothetical protein